MLYEKRNIKHLVDIIYIVQLLKQGISQKNYALRKMNYKSLCKYYFAK